MAINLKQYRLMADTIMMCSQYYDTKTLQHCLRVAKYAVENVCLRSDDDRQIAFIVALCHDLLEDTNISIETIAEVTELNVNFLTNVLGALTRKKSETYLDYIKRLKQNQSPYPYIVKMADMKDHLSQKDTLTEKLKEKYWNVLPELL